MPVMILFLRRLLAAAGSLTFAGGLLTIQSCFIGFGGGTEGEGHTDGNDKEIALSGRIVDVEGIRVSGAEVTLKLKVPATQLKKGAVIGADSQTVMTGADGFYRFTQLTVGAYQLEARKKNNGQSLAVLLPHIEWMNKARYLGEQVLLKTGGIKAQVVASGLPQSGAECAILGTSYTSITDENGFCVLDDLPSGTYTLRFKSPQSLATTLEGVVVTPGETTLLNETTPVSLGHDPALPPPQPRQIAAAIDTLAGVVHLVWPAVTVADLKGYFIYRHPAEVGFGAILDSAFTQSASFSDTVFSDTLGTETLRTVLYSVRSQDSAGHSSPAFSDSQSIQVPAPIWLRSAYPAHKGFLYSDSMTVFWELGGPARGKAQIEVSLASPDSDAVMTSLQCAGIGISSCALAGLIYGAQYEWRVTAKWSGRSQTTSPFVFTLLRDRPAVVNPIDTSKARLDTIEASYTFDSVINDTIYPDKFGPPNAMKNSGAITINAVRGYGLRLDGQTGHIRIDGGTYFTQFKSFMVDGWFRLPNVPTDYWRRLVGQWGADSREENSWQLGITSQGRLVFEMAKDSISSQKVRLESSAALQAETWMHIAAVYQGDSASLYLNGDLVARSPCEPFLTHKTPVPILMGAAWDAGNIVNNFMVDVDEIRLSNRILSAQQIQEKYLTLKP
jgi:Concanavalin A-like lectin/glucanases superfamily/Carboxypeptidase regulatory-like domain